MMPLSYATKRILARYVYTHTHTHTQTQTHDAHILRTNRRYLISSLVNVFLFSMTFIIISLKRKHTRNSVCVVLKNRKRYPPRYEF